MPFISISASMLAATLSANVHWASPDIAGGPSESNPQDGVVDALDMVQLVANWGPCDDACCRGDINRDGYVDSEDLQILLGVFETYDARTFARCRVGTDPGSPAA